MVILSPLLVTIQTFQVNPCGKPNVDNNSYKIPPLDWTTDTNQALETMNL